MEWKKIDNTYFESDDGEIALLFDNEYLNYWLVMTTTIPSTCLAECISLPEAKARGYDYLNDHKPPVAANRS